MRFATVETIYEGALKDPTIFFITGDLGHARTDDFKKKLKGRYYNAGMAEQNIIGIAAGLALSGMKVFVYSIVPFITLRCFEQIKVDVCSQNIDVTVIGIGGGFAYGTAGATHYSIEEIAAMRALPNMKIVVPSNPTEAKLLTKEVINTGGPAYIRIGRGKEADFSIPYTPKIGTAGVLTSGGDITIISSGTIVSEAIKVAEMLEKEGISTEVINMHTIKPLDEEIIKERAGKMKAIFTLEEHNVLGGLGGAVAEVLSELPERPIFKRFGIPDMWPETVGTQEYLRDITGISAEKVVESISEILK
jgi:transketolase